MLTHNLNMETEVIFGWMGLLACVSSVLLYKSKQDFSSQTKKISTRFPRIHMASYLWWI